MAEVKKSVIVPKANSQASIVAYANQVLTEHKKFNDYFSKMEAIDVAYARFQANKDPNTGVVSGQGVDAATVAVGVVDLPSTVPPVVVSQVDSMVAYLADVFLSGTPLFPVVSSPENKEFAEQLETLIDDHATLGGYARQLLMFLRDGVKYNICALEADWTSISQYSLLTDLLSGPQQKLGKDVKKYTKLKRLDMYNTIWDHNVSPGDVSSEGDYAGYIEILSRTKLKRFLNRLSIEGKAFNVKEATESTGATASPESLANYRVHPEVSSYVSARKPTDGMNWYSYLTGKADDSSSSIKTGNYEVFTLYARIMPSDFSLFGPESRTPQIWKFVIINNTVLVQAERIISAYDYLPILFGQPLEDGLGYQTQSIAESNIPFQSAATTLFNIRFNAARRAVSDRALFDADLISSADINAPVPAAKIPVRSNSLDGKKISDAYHQIPFDPRGTEAAFQDGMNIVAFGKELSGLNAPMQGQFQKGNKSVQEWNDTMGGSDARLRLPALTLEFQVFMPLKEILKLNIYQYGENADVISQKDGSTKSVDIEKLKTKVLAFKVADGYTPKSKLANTESIMQLMQILGQSQILQQRLGDMLPGMFVHLAQLMGVRGLNEYAPPPAKQQQNIQQAQMLQQGIDPRTGKPMDPTAEQSLQLQQRQQQIDQAAALQQQANAQAQAGAPGM